MNRAAEVFSAGAVLVLWGSLACLLAQRVGLLGV
jgi:hypothetical protein